MFYTNQIHQKKIIDLFPTDCIEEWLNEGKELSFKKGEMITIPDKMKDFIYLIKKGNASVFHIHIDGKECIISLLSKGDFIGLLDIFTEKESNVFAKALTSVTVAVISKEKIREIVENNSSISMAVIKHLSLKYQETTEILIQVAYGKVEERLIFLLKKMADPFTVENGWHPIPISITHRDLAGMVASTRETITVLINKLTETGVIMQKENRIWIKISE